MYRVSTLTDSIDIQSTFLDTSHTLFSRAAVGLGTLPKFLVGWPKNLIVSDESDMINITVIDLASEARRLSNLSELLSIANQYSDRNVTDDILVYRWVKSHSPLSQYGEDEHDLESKYDVRLSIHDTFEQDVAFFKKQTDNIVAYMLLLDQLDPIPFTPFIQDRAVHQFTFEASFSLPGLFDVLSVSSVIPIIILGDMIKVYSETNPDEIPISSISSQLQSIDTIILQYRIQSIRNETFKKITIKSLTPSQFTLEVSRTTTAVWDSNIILQTILGENIPYRNVNELLVYPGGFCGTENVYVWPILADLMLNLPEIGTMLAINDNRPIIDPYMGAHRVFFRHPMSEGSDQIYDTVGALKRSIAGLDDIFPPNTEYTQIRIHKANTDQDINRFLGLIGRLFRLYTLHSENTSILYDIFEIETEPPENDTSRSQSRISKLFLRSIDPLVFGGGYAVRCQPAERVPVIIPEDQVIQWEGKTGHRAIQFPKNDDVVQPRYYGCESEKYSYIGLVNNPNTVLGKQPCCFIRDTQNSKNMKEYYQTTTDESEIDDSKSNTAVYMKKTQKRIFAGEAGRFPDKVISEPSLIAELLNAAIVDTDTVFIRIGTDISPNAALACIVYALNPVGGIPTESVLIEHRRAIASNIQLLPLALQSFWTLSVEDLQVQMNDTETYLDPISWMNVLEEYFECHLLICHQKNITSVGELAIPPSYDAYLKHQRNPEYPTIILFVHSGAVSENLQYPHCELVIQVEKDLVEPSHVLFQRIVSRPYPTLIRARQLVPPYSTNAAHRFLWNVWDQWTTVYRRDILYIPSPRVWSWPIGWIVKAQWIDGYGKCRRLLIEWEYGIFTIDTSPLAPMILPIYDGHVESVSTTIAVRLSKQAYDSGSLNAFSLMYSIQYVEGSLGRGVCSARIYTAESIMIPGENQSLYYRFLAKQRIARALTNEIYYETSQWMYQQNKVPKDITIEDLRDIANNVFTINSTVKYGEIKETLGNNSTRSITGRIICSSDDIASRLMYQLQLMITRNPGYIVSFRDRIFMDGIYEDPEDFRPQKHTYIFQLSGENPTPTNDEEYHTELVSLLTLPKPYPMPIAPIHESITLGFYRNPTIFQGSPLLVQPMDTREDALRVGYLWQIDGYNSASINIGNRPLSSYYMIIIAKNGTINRIEILGNDSTENDSTTTTTITPKTTILVTRKSGRSGLIFNAVLPFYSKLYDE